jgi:manganese/zinc/iron transport system substrate-binding protein
MRARFGWVGLLWCAALSAAPQVRAGDTERYQVVCTVGMIADIVRQVGGERAEVVGLIGEGVDPHLYKATRNDVAALQQADIIFYNGLMLEGKMTDVLIKVARRGKPVYAVTEEIDEKYLREPKEMLGHYDPHVWMDVAAWSHAVQAVANALSEYDPEHADAYRARAESYRDELAKLDAYVRKIIATIPERQRVLITAHDAFGYFGRAYAIQVKGVQGLSTESEAGLQDINRLVDFIVENDVRAVFVESSVSDKNVRALVEGANARGKATSIGGSLYSDAMGSSGTYEGTYIGMIDHNATLIARSLGGEAPQRGMSGKLRAAKD